MQTNDDLNTVWDNFNISQLQVMKTPYYTVVLSAVVCTEKMDNEQ